MTNEMKLLHALCEALGFEVETTLDYMPRKEGKSSAMKHIRVMGPPTDRVLSSTGPFGKLDIDQDGEYTSLLISPVVDYKLHKRTDG